MPIRRSSAAHARDAGPAPMHAIRPAPSRSGGTGRSRAIRIKMIHGMPLQQPNLNRLLDCSDASRMRLRTARPPGQTRAQLAPRMFASRMVTRRPAQIPAAIFLMKRGTSMCVGHASAQGASKQYRQRFASTSASCGVKAGCRSGKRSAISGFRAGCIIAPRPPVHLRSRSSRPAIPGTYPRRSSGYSWEAKCAARCHKARPCPAGCDSPAPLPKSVKWPAMAGCFDLTIFHQFDCLQQPHSAHIADDRVLLFHVFQTLAQIRANLRAIVGQVLSPR